MISVWERSSKDWWVNGGEDGEEKNWEVKQLGMLCELFHGYGMKFRYGELYGVIWECDDDFKDRNC